MTNPVVEVEKLSYKYPSSEEWVLHNINFTVEKGEFLGIVGPTGAGKTTLALCLRGLIPHNFGGSIAGKVLINGQNTLEKSPGALADQVGIVFQNAETQAVGLTVLEDFAFGLENMQLSKEEMQQRIQRVAEIVGLAELFERQPWALSGGQKQRLAIGGVLVMEPNVLILDEPTAELDPVGKTEVFRIVAALQEERDLTIVMIEHEVETLADVADRILVLDQGEVALLAPPEEAFRQIDLFHRVRERVPFVAELLQDLIDRGLLPEERFTSREERAIAVLRDYLGGG
jgi:energy-coupling factor transporter ATP-binding protein EcfA2